MRALSAIAALCNAAAIITFAVLMYQSPPARSEWWLICFFLFTQVISLVAVWPHLWGKNSRRSILSLMIEVWRAKLEKQLSNLRT